MAMPHFYIHVLGGTDVAAGRGLGEVRKEEGGNEKVNHNI
jgi:hypothetical protein